VYTLLMSLNVSDLYITIKSLYNEKNNGRTIRSR